MKASLCNIFNILRYKTKLHFLVCQVDAQKFSDFGASRFQIWDVQPILPRPIRIYGTEATVGGQKDVPELSKVLSPMFFSSFLSSVSQSLISRPLGFRSTQ